MLTDEQRAINARQRVANALLEQGQQPIETTVAGGYVVPTSPLAGLDKVAQSFSGALIKKRVQEKQDAITPLYAYPPPVVPGGRY